MYTEGMIIKTLLFMCKHPPPILAKSTIEHKSTRKNDVEILGNGERAQHSSRLKTVTTIRAKAPWRPIVKDSDKTLLANMADL
jgi:hypothetical protein